MALCSESMIGRMGLLLNYKKKYLLLIQLDLLQLFTTTYVMSVGRKTDECGRNLKAAITLT